VAVKREGWKGEGEGEGEGKGGPKKKLKRFFFLLFHSVLLVRRFWERQGGHKVKRKEKEKEKGRGGV